MTTKPINPPPDSGEIVQFPDPPPEEMTAYDHVNFPGYPPSLAAHFGNPDTTIITSEVVAALIPSESYDGVRYPDLLIAFNVNPAARVARNGYLIPEQGKPPDFVLEVASPSTARRDETCKRDNYAAMGIPEYWRFDPTGGDHYETALAGDRLVDGLYRPVPIHGTNEGRLWGHSDALNLDLCWEEGKLRFWDPEARRYLRTFDEANEDRIAAEARVRELEEELRRLRNP